MTVVEHLISSGLCENEDKAKECIRKGQVYFDTFLVHNPLFEVTRSGNLKVTFVGTKRVGPTQNELNNQAIQWWHTPPDSLTEEVIERILKENENYLKNYYHSNYSCAKQAYKLGLRDGYNAAKDEEAW